jgi:hypothetical protein
VYLDVVQHFLQNINHPCGALDFLGYASLTRTPELISPSNPSQTTFPSWIPDWRVNSDYLAWVTIEENVQS